MAATLHQAALPSPQIREIARRHGATSVRLFGSFAAGTDTASSDIDLLVELDPTASLLDLIAIKQEVEDLTGRSVDVVTEKSISPYLRDSVLQDAIPL